MAVSRKVGIEFVVDGTSSVERAFSTVSSSATRSAEVVAEASNAQTKAVVAGRVKQIEALRASAAAFSEASGSYVKGSDEQIAASKLAADAQRKLQVALGETAAASAKTGSSFAAFAGRMSASGKRLSAVGRKLNRDVTLPIVAIGAVATKMALDYGTAINHVQALTGASAKQTKEWSDQILKVAPKLGEAPVDFANALYFVASAGVKLNQVMPITTAAVEASAAGMGDAQTIAQLLTSAINAYGAKTLSAKQAVDVLTQSIKIGKAEPADFAANLGKVIPVAEAMGAKFSEVSALVAELTNTGLDAAQAATAVRATLVGLLKPASGAATELKKLGFSVSGVQHEIRQRGLLKTLLDLKGRIGDNKEAMGKLFPNVRALTGFLALTGKNAKNAAEGVKSVGDSAGAAAKALRIAEKNPAFVLKKNLAQLKVAAIQIGNALIPVVTQIAKFVGGIAEKFQKLSPNAKKMILIFAGLAAAIGPVVSIIGAFATAIGAIAALSGPAAIIIGITAAIAGLVAAFVAAVKFPDQMKAALERMGLSAKQSGEVVHRLQVIFEVVKNAGEQLVAAIRAHWATISAVIKGAWLYISATVRNGLQVVRGVVEVISGLIHGDWSKAWQGIKDIVGGTLKQIQNELQTAAKVLGAVATAVGQAMWNGLKSGAEAAISWIAGKLSFLVSLYNKVAGLFSGNATGNRSGYGGLKPDGTFSAPSPPKKLPGHAAGIINAPRGHWAKVGERGPETMWVPKGASIIPHGAGGNMSSLGMLQAVIPVYLNGRLMSRETRREALRSANRGNDWSRRTLAPG